MSGVPTFGAWSNKMKARIMFSCFFESMMFRWFSCCSSELGIISAFNIFAVLLTYQSMCSDTNFRLPVMCMRENVFTLSSVFG